MRVERAAVDMVEAWVMLRRALWPELDPVGNRSEVLAMLDRPDMAAFLAHRDGVVLGFAEAALRHDHVNGCATSPVAFLEGIHVRPEARRQGVARQLCRAVERWAREQGASELASDAALANHGAHLMHAALGFTETERVVYFRKRL